MASPTTTSESVVKKSHLSTPTRFAIRLPGSFQLCSRRKKMFLHELLEDAAAMLVILKLIKAGAGRRQQNHISGTRGFSGGLDSLLQRFAGDDRNDTADMRFDFGGCRPDGVDRLDPLAKQVGKIGVI